MQNAQRTQAYASAPLEEDQEEVRANDTGDTSDGDGGADTLTLDAEATAAAAAALARVASLTAQVEALEDQLHILRARCVFRIVVARERERERETMADPGTCTARAASEGESPRAGT